MFVTGSGRERNIAWAQLCAGARKIIALQAGAGQKSFDASRFAAIAGRTGAFIIASPGQRIMPPFARDPVSPRYQLLGNDNTASHSCAKNNPENDGSIGRSAV